MPDQIKRLLIALILFIALFFLLRYLLIPPTFGKFGHYRAEAIEDAAASPLKHAGRESCRECHESVVEELAAGFHSTLSCEGCHGPAYRHAVHAGKADPENLPDSLRLRRPLERESCARCHDLNPSRIKLSGDSADISIIKMVNVTDHNYFPFGENEEIIRCVECHYSHSP